MSLDLKSLIVTSVLMVNLILVLFFSFTLHASTSSRARLLWKLVAIDGVISTVIISSFFLLSSSLSILNTSAGIFYLLVGSFVFAIEVPGYLCLMKHDERIVNYLEEWRSEMVKLGYDFGQYGIVKSKSAEGVTMLQEVNLNRLVNDFIEHCGRMSNVDKGFWSLVLGEVNRAIDEAQGRSKHPAPKLIELLSLSGLSFVIAQVLKTLG